MLEDIVVGNVMLVKATVPRARASKGPVGDGLYWTLTSGTCTLELSRALRHPTEHYRNCRKLQVFASGVLRHTALWSRKEEEEVVQLQ